MSKSSLLNTVDAQKVNSDVGMCEKNGDRHSSLWDFDESLKWMPVTQLVKEP